MIMMLINKRTDKQNSHR